jgi:flagellar biosynthetic protein FlhB
MPQNDGQEKTEQPTQKRLDDSRQEGQVAKSMEVNSFAIFVTGILLLYFAKNYIGSRLSLLTEYLFSSLDTLELNLSILSIFAAKGFIFLLLTLAPVVGALVVAALVAGYSQTGFKITLKAMQPKFSKLNPLKGAQQKFFSSTSLVELVKSIVKLLVIGGFAYWILSDSIIFSLELVDYSINDILKFMMDTAFSLVWKVGAVFAAIAIADFIFQKYKHKKELKMTKQEVKDENKQTDGDPQVKSQIKSKQTQMARNRMMQEVPEADVVITNPTHFAVALKYEAETAGAPKVVAKGMDLVAQKIKEVAKENGVPLHEDVELARSLYKLCNIGDEIPEHLFKAVAQILAYIYKLKETKKQGSILG